MDTVSAFEDLAKFRDRNGQEYYFIELIKPDILKVWKDNNSKFGWHTGQIGGVKLNTLDREVLEELNVWEELSDELKSDIKGAQEFREQQIKDRMSKARQARKAKYPNIPREITCTKCGTVKKVTPSTIAKRVEAAGILLDDYLKVFECNKCNPRKRGKKAKDYGDVPKQLVCSCGKVTKYHPTALINMAKKKGISVKKLVKDYRCQKCKPTKGRKKKKKKS